MVWLCDRNQKLLIVLLSLKLVYGYDSDEYALYDLVEEVNRNFYDFLGVEQNVPSAEIRKAYRRLSLTLHPDKNSAADAEVMFRQLAAIYDVLKDENMRQKYDNVLKHGLPNWRQPVFYFRRIRKLSWTEFFALLTVFLTVGHYLVLWAAYFEKYLTLDEQVLSKLRKKEKQLKRSGVDVDMLIDERVRQSIEKPSWRRLLPFAFVSALPGAAHSLRLCYLRYREELEIRRAEAAAAAATESTNADSEQRPKVRRAKPQFLAFNDVTDCSEQLMPVTTTSDDSSAAAVPQQVALRTSDWTEEEMACLIRFSTEKFPLGTTNRWEKIAEALHRKVPDVTHMVGVLKRLAPKEYQKLAEFSAKSSPSKAEDSQNGIIERDCKSTLGSAAQTSVSDNLCSNSWSASDQKLLERALIEFPKTEDARWDKIAERIPGKTKQDCIARYKELVQMLRQRKTQTSS